MTSQREDQNLEDDVEVDAAQAFENLRAEVALQRRAMVELGNALKAHRAPDLGPDIARIQKGLERLEVVHKHPALQMTPVQYGQAMTQAGLGTIQKAADQLQRATQEVERERAQLSGLVRTANTQKQQKQTLIWTAGAGVILGMVLSLLLLMLLPVRLSSHAAAFLLGGDRWEAGSTLMRLANPQQWQEIVETNQLLRANETPLAACKVAAAKTKREQRCVIAVSPL